MAKGEQLFLIQFNTNYGLAMSQVVSRRPHTAEARFFFFFARLVLVGFVVHKVTLGQIFPSTFGLSLAVSFHQLFIMMYLPVTLVILASDTSLRK